MTPANRITNELLIEIPARWPQVTCWRSNTGAGVGMHQVNSAIAALQVGNVAAALQFLRRPMKFGLIGSADISAMIGPHGQFVQIEVKAGRDRQSEQQKKWQAVCVARGVPYIIARETRQAMEELGWVIGQTGEIHER